MFKDLQTFIDALEARGELKRIATSVDPVLEVAAITDKISKSPCPHLPSSSTQSNDPNFCGMGGHALLFENIQGSDFPLLINAWGSYRRMEIALGCDDLGHTPGGFDALASKIGALVKPEPPRSLRELFAKAKQFLPLLKIPPKRRNGSGLCQQVIKTGSDIDLTRLPILRCWPLDGDFAAVGYPSDVNENIPDISRGSEWETLFRGRYITLAGIHTIHAEDIDAAKPASHNIGMYRVQLLAKDRVAMHWHMHHDGARHWRSWKKLGKPMPVAIVLGGESIMPYAATAPLPPGISELLLAGYLNRGGIPLVRAKTVPLWIPANAEIVIEGYVAPDAGFINFDPRIGETLGPNAVFEGPFGDHTGFYSMPDRYPIVTVTAITHRKNAVYPTTIVGLPPQEDYYLGKATERLFLPLLKTIIHDVDDYDLPLFGAFHNCACIKLTKSYPLQARRMMHSVWGAGQMAWTKSIFVVDNDVDVHNTQAVLARAATHCHPLRDIEFVNGPLDILDHAAPRLGAGMKIGFDCTRKIAGEEVAGISTADQPRSVPAAQVLTPYLAQLRALPTVTNVSCPKSLNFGWLFVAINKSAPGQGHELLKSIFALPHADLKLSVADLPPFVIVVDDSVNVANIDQALFHWIANFDASRDLTRFIAADKITGRLGMDATRKSPSSADHRHNQPVRPWPPVISMDQGTLERVSRRWAEYELS